MNTRNILILAAVAALAMAAYYMTSSRTGTQSAGIDITMPSLSQAAAEGEENFGKYCAACHGEKANGSENGPPLIHKIYEPSHHGDASFELAAKNGVRAHHWKFGNMPPVEGISDDEIAAIIVFVREVQRANGIN